MGHGVGVVPVVYPQVRRARRALPVYSQVERSGVDPVRLHLNTHTPNEVKSTFVERTCGVELILTWDVGALHINCRAEA